MNRYVVYIVIAIIMLIIDGLWIGVIRKNFYSKEIKNIQGDTMHVRFPGVVMAYTLMLVSIIFITIPLVRKNLNSLKTSEILKLSFLYGGLIGLVIYGVYNGTNYATFKRYSLEYVITDTLWGVFIMGFITYIGVYLYEKH